jgi:hypothetical protein
MTRTTAARLGGFTFLFYIAVGIGSMAMGLHGLAQTLATAAQNGSAIVLALTLYIVTQAENRLLATLGMLLRLAEGLLGPITTVAGITLARPTLIDATLFAMGSLFFCWLLLRGRMIPAALARIGVVASVILVVGLPLQLAGMLGGAIAQLMWMPMLAFEVPGGVWLMVKAVPPDAPARLQDR